MQIVSKGGLLERICVGGTVPESRRLKKPGGAPNIYSSQAYIEGAARRLTVRRASLYHSHEEERSWTV